MKEYDQQVEIKPNNKLYLITISSNDRWEMAEGVYLISACNKKSALKQLATVNKQGYAVSSIDVVKPTSKEKVIFEQQPVIE